MSGFRERPRELKWYHAGPILFGDWGTSRLYVLGLAFAFNGRASFWMVAAMSLVLIAVGWCYTIACRLFPDGGGVYSSAQQRSQLLAVFGGLLLCADYVVTASLSCLEAFHYLGIKDYAILGILPVDAALAALGILAIGAVNVLGPTKTGTAAMIVAMATVVFTLIIGVACLPYLGNMVVESPFKEGPGRAWVGFTEIILALSGVEAIANMTGVMVQPVGRTAKRAILPVMTEIVLLNLILCAAMLTLADDVLYRLDPETGGLVPAHTGDMIKVIAETYVGPAFAAASGVCFAALLFSAVNTAIGALVSVLFMLSRDRELPEAFGRLNRFGMPKLPLVIAAVVPAVVVVVFPYVESLGGLYAIGIVGAIGINLGSIATNRALDISRGERILMAGVTLLLIAIEITIVFDKPDARSFALVVLAAGLSARLGTMAIHPAVPLGQLTRRGYVISGVVLTLAVLFVEIAFHDTLGGFAVSAVLVCVLAGASYKVQQFRPEILAYRSRRVEVELGPDGKPLEIRPKRLMMVPGGYKPKARVMVATQGNPRLLKFAFEEAKNRHAELQILFLRHLAVTPMGLVEPPKLDEDEDALKLFEQVREQAKKEGVPIRLLYGVARDIPDAILDMAVTHGADLLMLGATRRGTLWKAMKGDVISGVAEQLPESVGLLLVA